MDDLFGGILATEEAFGEAHVVQPETTGSAINKYTTYLVQAKMGEESLNSRKRYSDFEWLRKALTACFPGVRIPPLPKKHSTAQGVLAKTGVSEDGFIEARRAGLEDFLKRCFKRRELCIDSKLLKGFLGQSSDEALEEFKRKIDNVSMGGKCQKYAQIYADVKDASPPAEDRVELCSQFLTDQMQQLRELADGYKEVADAQEAATKALLGAQLKLAAISHSEASALTRAGVPKEARVELVEGLRQQSKIMQAAPAMHYDLLYEAAERELLEAEAMHEAIESVEGLKSDMQEATEKAQVMGKTLEGVLAGGEIPSTGTGVARMLGISKPKDREERIAEMKADHEKKQKDVTAMQEFQQLAEKVLVCREIDRFFSEKVTGHRQAKDSFASLSQSSAERFVSIWGGGASQGYPASAISAELPEAEVEYE